MAYKYTVGGKKGKTFTLRESKDLVVVRTTNEEGLEEASLSLKSRNLLPRMMQVASLPEANVAVYKVVPDAAKDKKKLRDEVRSQLKTEKSIRFAGRVLEDPESGSIFVYTENFFVKFKDDTTKKRCKEILKSFELKIENELKFATNAYFTKSKEGTGLDIFKIANELLAQKEVEYCHPELVQERRSRFVHPMQWHLIKTTVQGKVIDQHIGIEEAWKVTKGKNAVIAIIDDGVDVSHEEFSGASKIVAPRDTLEESSDARPKYASERHGTACAGVACANGKKQAAGVAPEAKLMPIRSGNLGSISEANAFAWAADNGADVISCSWGPADGYWANPNDPLHTTFAPLFDSTRLAIDYAIRTGRQGKGCVITWAAGNGRENTAFDGYASYEKVIAVAACNDHGQRSVYSDFGNEIWCCFPSSDFEFLPFNHPAPDTFGIWTTDRSGARGYNPGGSHVPASIGDKGGKYTATFGGTSSACPGAAGVAALILAVNPELSWEQVRELMKACCDKIDASGGNYSPQGHSISYGYGRLNARKAVQLALTSKSSTPDPDITGSIMFTGYGNIKLVEGESAGGFKKGNKLSGIKLSLDPLHPQIGISYCLAFNGLARIYKGIDGSFAGVKDKRRKSIGLSVTLTGALAGSYDVIYAIKTSRNGKWQEAANGEWAGRKGGNGAGIGAVRITVRPKA